MSHATLILLRHGQSEWNRVGRFTGWTDIGLSPGGVEESQRAARLLQAAGCTFERCFSSVLQRSVTTAQIILRAMEHEQVAIEQSWRLNERHYGALQGLGPVAAVCRYGFRILRTQREFACQPPPLAPEDPRFPGFDPLYASLRPEELPRTESLRDTYERVLPYWQQRIVPELASGRSVLVVSHKNVLRGLRKLLEQRSDSEIRNIKVPTCVPMVFTFDAGLNVIDHRTLRPGVETEQAANGAGG